MCKNCKYFTPDAIGVGWCMKREAYTAEHGFCESIEVKK